MPRILFQNKERFYLHTARWNGRLRCNASPVQRFPRDENSLRLSFPLPEELAPSELTALFVHAFNLSHVFGEELIFEAEAFLVSLGISWDRIQEIRTGAIEASYYSCQTSRDSHVVRDLEKRGLTSENPTMSEGQMAYR